MEEGPKLRLVRCPKCGNVLTEEPDYSVYQCGGCGAFLRAKKKVVLGGKDMDVGSFENLEIVSEGGGGLGDASATERERDRGMLHRRRKDTMLKERTVNFAGGGLPRTGNKEGLIDNSGRGMKEQSSAEKRQSPYRPAFVHSSNDKGVGQLPAEFESSVGYLRPRDDGFRGGNRRNRTEFAYPDEGPSNYHLGSSYGHSKLVGNYNDLDSPRRVARLEMDQCMLLKRVDELQQRLDRVSDRGANQRGRAPAAGRMAGHATYNVPMEPLTPDKHVLKHPHFREYGNGHGHIPSVNHSALPSYNDPFPPQLPKKFYSHQLPRQYRHQPPPNCFVGKHMSQELPATCIHNTLNNQAGCSCVHCSSRSWLASSQVPPIGFNNRRFPKVPSDSNFNAGVNPTLRHHSCSPQANPSMLRHSQPRARRPVDIDTDVDEFHQRFPRKPVLPHGNRRFFHPIAGGAPFISCYNCFEILTLPKKLKSREKNPKKLRCGACSQVFLLETLKKKVIISVLGDKDQLSAEVGVDDNSLEFSKEAVSVADGSPSTIGVKCTNGFDDHESVDFKENSPSKDQKLNVSESEERNSPSEDQKLNVSESEERNSPSEDQKLNVSESEERTSEDQKLNVSESEERNSPSEDQKLNVSESEERNSPSEDQKLNVSESEERNSPSEDQKLNVSESEERTSEDQKLNVSESEERNSPSEDQKLNVSESEERNSPSEDQKLNVSESEERNSPSEDQKLNVSESEERECDTSSSVSSGEEEIPDSMLVHRDASYFVELTAKDEISSVFQESPLQNHLSDLSSNHERERGGKGSGIKCTEEENVVVYESMSRQFSAKDVSAAATEIEVLVSECLPSISFSQDSVEVSKEELHRTSKGSESHFVARIKKSFWDFSKSNQRVDNEKPTVSVNGKPIPFHMVKRAEKLAGTIEPGDYWYDVRAGFWGVIGQSCLGILPPFIEEFNYPMPEHCAAGNTGVFVNGRELHQRDLDLLSSRGLPTARHRSYIVEISGNVFSEDSGEEVAMLGNLAPTVQKLNTGFGMRVPKHTP